MCEKSEIVLSEQYFFKVNCFFKNWVFMKGVKMKSKNQFYGLSSSTRPPATAKVKYYKLNLY